MKFKLERVEYMPKELKPATLYVSEEFSTAAHLCACGCGSKIRTPLGPTEWNVKETNSGPSLQPSVGSWQQSCKSHYWIDRGEIKWAKQWTTKEILEGRSYEEKRRSEYFDGLIDQPKKGKLQRFWNWLKSLMTLR